jgi:nucleotide-binding universal stress UspA family protein
MLRLRRILFATDGSPSAVGAFLHAAYLAEHTGAELHALHVEEPDAEPASVLEPLRITPEDIAADLRLPSPAPEASRWAPGEPVPFRYTQEQAPRTAPAILDYVRREEIDLVVMGTHGRHGVRRMLIGSVAEEVVRLAPCPVFTVRLREEGGRGWPVRRVLAAHDLSEHAASAARHAAALAVTYGATLDLLHVVDAALLPTATVPLLGTFRVSSDDVRERAQEVLEAQAAALAETFPAVGDVGVFVRVGHPADEIVAFAEAHGADVLVLGSHGLTGLQRLLMGSVAETVVRTAPCPVFTVKSFGGALVPSAESAPPPGTTAPRSGA